MSKYRTEDLDQFASMFRALASPQRLRAFVALTTCCQSDGCCDATAQGVRQCVGDLAQNLDVAASTVSHHLKELRQAGLLRAERRGKTIQCSVSDGAVRRLADFFADARAACCGSPVPVHTNGGSDGDPDA